ncbi:MAG: hypothetical protein ACE5EH_02030 [Gammaproteobacteria bacterium]
MSLKKRKLIHVLLSMLLVFSPIQMVFAHSFTGSHHGYVKVHQNSTHEMAASHKMLSGELGKIDKDSSHQNHGVSSMPDCQSCAACSALVAIVASVTPDTRAFYTEMGNDPFYTSSISPLLRPPQLLS